MEHLTVRLLPFVPASERRADDVLHHSFPAGDPPPRTGDGAEVSRTGPADGAVHPERENVVRRLGALAAAFRPIGWLLGAAAVALLVPIFVVLLPLALMYRLVLELAVWPRSSRNAEARARRRASTQHVITGV